MLRAKPTAVSLPRGVITAMFTDIVESTQIKSSMEGETSARRDSLYRRQIKEPHDAVVLTCVRDADGYLVNPTGDGFCTTFVDAEEAVLCALRIQRHFEENPIPTPLGALRIRIGLHTGIAGPTGDDYIASTIDKTARVQSQAAPGQVFVSHQTQVLVSDKTQNVHFEARGIFDLKGLQAEELYQAMAQPDLHLPSVSPDLTALRLLDKGRAAPLNQNPSEKGQSNGSGLRALTLIGLALLLIAGAGWWGSTRRNPAPAQPVPTSISTSASTSVPTSTSPASESQILALGSHWSGNFHFLPPTPHYDGSISLEVTARSGDTFAGLYSSENDAYQWLVEGTVEGQKLRWNYIKAIKNPGKEDAVGKAFAEATIKGDQIKGLYRTANNPKEIAALDLRRDK